MFSISLEFFADKIPWVDSIWDAVHTVIRPIGGALLAIQVLGHPSPAFTVIVALLAGGTSLLAHTAKAATRLASNTSPEPFTNIGLSLGEDAAVLGGLTLVHFSPLLALIIFLIGIGAFFYFARRILRSIKGKIGMTRKKLDNRQIVTCRCNDRSHSRPYSRLFFTTLSNWLASTRNRQ